LTAGISGATLAGKEDASMRYLVLAICLLLLPPAVPGATPSARAPEMLSAGIEEVNTTCSCCHRTRRCAARVTRRAVLEGRLPAVCVRVVRRAAAFLCRRLRPGCQVVGGCLDTSSGRCTGDSCRLGASECGVNTRCSFQCGPGRGLRWRRTCGDILCPVDEPPNAPPCQPDQVQGLPCTTPGVSCDPGQSCNALLVCSANQLDLMCPISRRAAKEGIEYLDDAAARRIHDQLMHYPLATWRYRTAPAGRGHLGFIIDDVGRSPAVAGDDEHVDLYGYTSTAVAALQVQAKEIDALRAEVAALRRELARRQPGRAR
jgi:hypothetical protein